MLQVYPLRKKMYCTEKTNGGKKGRKKEEQVIVKRNRSWLRTGHMEWNAQVEFWVTSPNIQVQQKAFKLVFIQNDSEVILILQVF